METETWEIILSSDDHENIFVIVEAPVGTMEDELEEMAIRKATENTFLWSKKKINEKGY